MTSENQEANSIGDSQVEGSLKNRLSHRSLADENHDSTEDSCYDECFKKIAWPLPQLQLGTEKDDGRFWLDLLSGARNGTVSPRHLRGPPIVVNAIGG